MLENATLVWDLEQANKVALGFSTSLDPETIARLATDGFVEQFNCAFARIWLVEPDQTMLKLVASSGLYTRTDGTFSRIPMGEFKIGKIAQNRVSLLSNNLAKESWVRNPDWAIANNINGFAGYPLAHGDKVIGVLAVFSHDAIRPEFLKILSSLCTTLTVALEMASLHQSEQQVPAGMDTQRILANLSLSDAMAHILGQATVLVLGTERCLDVSKTHLFLRTAETLKDLDCSYCRLTYGEEAVTLEAIAAAPVEPERNAWERTTFGRLSLMASCFNGSFKISSEPNIKAIQVALTFPVAVQGTCVRIQCASPLVQTGLMHLASGAGLQVCVNSDPQIPLLTDQVDLLETSHYPLWVSHSSAITPKSAKADLQLSITAEQLREAVASVMQGETWGLDQGEQQLSARERDVLALLVQGFRDRDIAEQLFISDSTVKFHINNILVKLNAKTRLQALYNLMSLQGHEI
ncbi:LuxR C-terminal-related transcriptional regulator [Acaryochloris sp. CCMEE 5410]|uniref:LuxR C-terminal-related transcriptional regulator n=1 Tax=Acaryochloris sp. CCMEE 5410 TaxID=310037 RepID=UPI0002484D11|nr:LuxR C-terminal-related transcriptional regulator [Acaryochloris sp. CCMEE 5410]KAI9133550.1 GAF domain-containing protein [Acaryochloris sp. CCMEE 5410]